MRAAINDQPHSLRVVEVRKYGPEAEWSTSQCVWFRYFLLPLLRFSIKVFKIPAIGAVDADGRFSWSEPVAIATDAQTAKSLCQGEFSRIYWLPVNSSLPEQSVEYKEEVYPNSARPRRFKGLFPAAVPASELHAEQLLCNRMSDQIDRMITKARAPVST